VQALTGAVMRGSEETSGSLFSHVDLEAHIPARHPLRKILKVLKHALASLDAEFAALYTDFGRLSIPPERLIRASLIQILFAVRSERQLKDQMEYNLLFRWVVGLGVDDPVWVPTALNVVNRIQSGAMWVSCYGLIDPSVGIHGTKMSGYGAKGTFAHLDTYLTTKSVYIQR
jgi:hypothetical protein